MRYFMHFPHQARTTGSEPLFSFLGEEAEAQELRLPGAWEPTKEAGFESTSAEQACLYVLSIPSWIKLDIISWGGGMLAKHK